MATRVVFRDVRKTFRRRNRSDSLRDAVPRMLMRLAGRGQPDRERFVALDGVSFTVGEREVVGIVGANGAGKSTSLRLAAGVYQPDAGTVEVNGRVSALIELSAGFHPDLSGRENIHLVGALHGLRRRAVAAAVDDVAAFADIGDFLDSPVRTYSTGMAVRLGFAVAAHVPADVLLVDEVLAVGDAEFRAKCLRRMSERRDEGVSVLFVSHNLAVMEQFCDRLIFVHHGRIVAEGAPAEIIARYRRTTADERIGREGDGSRSVRLRRGTHELRIEDVSLAGGDGGGPGAALYGGALRLAARWESDRPLSGVRLCLRFHTVNGVLCAASAAPRTDAVLDGRGELHVEIPALELLPGAYDVSVEARDDSGLVVLDQHDRLYALTIHGARPPGAEGVVALRSTWDVRGSGDGA